MADLAQKKASFVRRYVTAIETLLNNSATIAALNSEWSANAYPTDAVPTENNITDEDLALVAPWLTALQLNQAEGAAATVNGTVEANRGYLEAVRS